MQLTKIFNLNNVVQILCAHKSGFLMPGHKIDHVFIIGHYPLFLPKLQTSFPFCIKLQGQGEAQNTYKIK